MATRGGRRPRFKPSMATRGRRPPQHASSEQVGRRPHSRRSPGGLARCRTPGWHHVHTLDDHPGGWHTNREGGRSVLVSHLAILCRDPNRFGPAIATRGGCRPQHANSERGCGPSSSYDTLLFPRFVPRPAPVFLHHGYCHIHHHDHDSRRAPTTAH